MTTNFFCSFPCQKINGSVRSTHACKPGEGIINVAKELNATMIVTGSRGHGKLRRTLLGSVSDYLIHHADIPVLVCRHQSFKWRHSRSEWLLKFRIARSKRNKNPYLTRCVCLLHVPCTHVLKSVLKDIYHIKRGFFWGGGGGKRYHLIFCTIKYLTLQYKYCIVWKCIFSFSTSIHQS